MSTLSFEQVLDGLVNGRAEQRLANANLVDSKALTHHLRLTLLMVGLSFGAVIMLIAVTRMVPLSDKQVALVAVVTVAGCVLFVVSLLSAATAIGVAFARQRIELQRATRQSEELATRYKQAELDASEEAQRTYDNSIAFQVAADVLWAELTSLRASAHPIEPENLDAIYAYMEVLAACNRFDRDQLADGKDLATTGKRVFKVYEERVNGKLAQQAGYVRIKTTFDPAFAG